MSLVGGSAVTVAQRWQVVPLIIAAEAYEARPALTEVPAHSHDAGEAAGGHHHHDAPAWQPQDGLERTFWTFVANLLVNMGFAALLVSAIAWSDSKGGGSTASARTGLLLSVWCKPRAHA